MTHTCPVDYGNRLEAALAHACVTRSQLAKALGVSEQAIGLVVRGKSNALTALNNSRAAAFLHVNPDWLATGEGEMRINREEFMPLTPEERDIVIAMRVLGEEERREVKRLVLNKAKDHMAQLDALLRRQEEPVDNVVPLKR